MKKNYLTLVFIFAAILIVSIFIAFNWSRNKSVQTNPIDQSTTASPDSQNQDNQANQASSLPEISVAQNDGFQSPLDRLGERITKKKFGQYITPQNSPVRPEKFRGYHTGTDFEIFPEELNVDVSVRAICGGKLALKKTATGYGGVLVENCELDNQPITVVYGHLKLASITKKAGDMLAKGEEIGILGKAFSAETNGERKHLHLAIHKGNNIDIRGYVQSRSELSEWLDPCTLDSVCQ